MSGALPQTASDLLSALLRRGSLALRRRIETRRSLARLRAAAPLPEGSIEAGVLTTGAIGDQIVVARFLRDLAALCERLRFDLYVPNLAAARWVYAPVAGVRDVLQDQAFGSTPRGYAVALEIAAKPMLRGVHAVASERLLSPVIERLRRFAEQERRLAGLGRENSLAHEMVFRHNQTRATILHFVAGVPYGGDRLPLAADPGIVARLGLRGQTYVTLHNGFDTAEPTRNSTKTYAGFADAVAQVRRERPDVRVVQLGAATSRPIAGTDVNLLGRTSLPEAAALLAAAACHLDNESGLVHVASCFGTPCCVVYGPTNPDYFRYPGHIGLRPLACGGCWAITADWMRRCPRGMAHPVCTHTQPPAAVAAAVLRMLAKPPR